MRLIQPSEIQPTVRIVNFFQPTGGSVWGPRVIPDLELILVVRGRFFYERDQVKTLVRAGEVLCIPPQVEHVFRQAETRPGAVISCIHGEMIEDGMWAAGDYRLNPQPQLVTETRQDQVFLDLFKRCDEVFQKYSRYRDPLLKTIVRAIWLRLAEYWQGSTDRVISIRMEQMVKYLRDHLTEPISRRDLAGVFSMTPEHINALFKKELGITPTQLVHRERVYRAYQLIQHEGLSVKEAAPRVGFCDQFYFSKVFKRIMGVSPSTV
jgi:AraC-like DNA-binding protein/quercetin dioxygenase-like cupin family protein